MADTHNVVVVLTEYPDSLDNSLGNALAAALSDVATACAQRIACGYDAARDDGLPPHTLDALIWGHMSEATTASPAVYRECLVQVAALAVAAIGRWDRITGDAHG